jgi:predicted MPP superfamily phosphohydrolase
MLHPAILFTLLMLAALGYVRTGAFVINHTIFGHRHEKPFLKWTVRAIAPLFLGLTMLLVPFFRDRDGEPSLAAVAGAWWLAVAAGIGLYWLVERAIVVTQRSGTMEGTRKISQQIIRLRKAHLPFKLQRLGLHNDVYDLEVNHFEIIIPDLPPHFVGYRLAFLSDLHVEGFMHRKLYDTALRRIVELNADVVLFGGDFVSRRKNIDLMAEWVTAGLAPPDGMFAVLGNHDYWSDPKRLQAALEARGVRFLLNESVAIERGGDQIRIVGIDEVYRGEPEVSGTLDTIRASTPRIVISHHPDIVDRIDQQRIDLLLCGHTHGGQIRAPFLGPIILPSLHEGKYDTGFFRMRRLLMYVGRGVGAVPPVRILCRPEVALFDLVRE